MIDERNERIQSRFGVAASDYVTSAVHAQGPDLQWLVETARLDGSEVVVDVATGTGHTALALAPHAREVVAIDFTTPMLEAGRKLAEERHISNVRFIEGDAHALPLPDAYADVVACRHSAHHFVDLPQAVREWARILKPGGRLVLIDAIVPEEQVLDDFINQIEILRDPSHIRNRSVSAWLHLLEEAGISARLERSWGIHMDVPTWTQRMRTPTENVQSILSMFAAATPEEQASLKLQQVDGVDWFDLPTGLFVGEKNK
ncbi:putative methyltransferase YcgJ [Ktedonobacter sp. SOSP1-52]|uniref:class I SAM-dependent methyltransferase n=1 Tax=Ktedonobacter sp. SOSP1-52 TaxID=2778366 RepID=UPI00191530E4|nr:methyltransferase domain-containing protein [Ktedonobacter sp. SOSP1-52]GHO66050.1 putative methyltransferase YcgJ [Ktedonobacter sp. SOSP1-52]